MTRLPRISQIDSHLGSQGKLSPSRQRRRLTVEVLESRHLLAVAPYEAHFDFGTSSSPVAPGFTRIVESTRYSDTESYGWADGTIFSRDRRIGSALERDLNFTRDGTFVVDLPNGEYDVKLILGDLGPYAHDNVGVMLEGVLRDSVTTPARQVNFPQYDVTVSDGQLTLRIVDRGGRDSNVVIEALDILTAGSVVPELSIADATHVEGDSAAQDWVFPVSLSVAAQQEVSVEYSTRDGTAIAGEDYEFNSGTLRIPAGQTDGTIAVRVYGDTSIESDESYFVDLRNIDGATLSLNHATGTILNDDVPPTLSVSLSQQSVSESAGADTVTATITRTGSTAQPLTVSVSSSDPDEASVPTAAVIEAGAHSVTVPVAILDDSAIDSTQIVLFTAIALDYVTGNATLEVTDDDRPPFEAFFDFGTSGSPVEAGYASVTERTRFTSELGYGWLSGAVRSRDRGTGTALTRDFNYLNDGTFGVSVPNGRYQVAMVLGDLGRYAHDQVGIFLEDEQRDAVTTAAYQVVSRTYETEVTDGQLTLRIRDLGGRDTNGVIEALEIVTAGPLVPQLSIADVTREEGNSGETEFAFTVTLSTATNVDVSVRFATQDNGAESGSDYIAASGTLIIPAGQTAGTIRVAVHGDKTIESDEDFSITLSDVVNATITNVRAVGSILNDDFPPTLQLTAASNIISEAAGANAAIGTVTRSGSTHSALTIDLSSSDPSEVTVPSRVTIPAGQASATFAIGAVDDSASDGVQRVTLTATAVGYVRADVDMEVTDDDQPPFEAFFDFGTSSSPLSDGFLRVSEATSYEPSRAYGWVAGTVASRDRGAGGLVERDFVFAQDATFAVDLPNGGYEIDVILGDKGQYSHDAMGIYLEGVHRATLSTAARQVVGRSFDVDVSDGQLTLHLQDLGGRDANVVIEGLRVLAAGTEIPQSTAWWPARRGIPNALFSQPGQQGGYDYFTVNSQYQRSENNIRVLLPAGYNPANTYPVIYVLPVEKGNGRQFGDGLTTILNSGLHLQHDAIFVSLTFSDTPWYADHVSNMSVSQETYFRSVSVPFIWQQYSVIDGRDGRLLLGYRKSGYGAISMLLRHPGYFGRALAWDAPLAMSDPASGWDFLSIVGSRDNFQRNYQITNLLRTHGTALQGQAPRIFLQGYSYDFTRADHAAIDAQMNSLDIPHIYEPGRYRSHLWSSGWMPDGVDTLLSGA